MGWMFNGCHKLKKIRGFSKFNTSKVTNMRTMFQDCNELEKLKLFNFDTSNVTDMGWMFNKCYKLKKIKGINTLKTSKVTNMRMMFQDCNELEYLDLSNFDTSNVTDITGMFNKCHKLKQIKGINNFNTSKINKIVEIFDQCKELEFVDLTKFRNENDTPKDIFAVIFQSNDQVYNYPVVCKKSDYFSTLEEKLYLEVPKLKEKKYCFLVNGNIVNTKETLDKNKIKSGDIILMHEIE